MVDWQVLSGGHLSLDPGGGGVLERNTLIVIVIAIFTVPIIMTIIVIIAIAIFIVVIIITIIIKSGPWP